MRSIGTLTRADLAESINRRVGLSRADSLEMVESILGHLCEALSEGENVKISGFGTFLLRDKAERVGRNPNQPGSSFVIPPRATVKFKAGKIMRQRVEKLSRELKEAAERRANGAPKSNSSAASVGTTQEN